MRSELKAAGIFSLNNGINLIFHPKITEIYRLLTREANGADFLHFLFILASVKGVEK